MALGVGYVYLASLPGSGTEPGPRHPRRKPSTYPRRTLDVPSTYPRRQARTLDTIFCEDSLDRSLVLDI